MVEFWWSFGITVIVGLIILILLEIINDWPPKKEK